MDKTNTMPIYEVMVDKQTIFTTENKVAAMSMVESMKKLITNLLLRNSSCVRTTELNEIGWLMEADNQKVIILLIERE